MSIQIGKEGEPFPDCIYQLADKLDDEYVDGRKLGWARAQDVAGFDGCQNCPTCAEGTIHARCKCIGDGRAYKHMYLYRCKNNHYWWPNKETKVYDRKYVLDKKWINEHDFPMLSPHYEDDEEKDHAELYLGPTAYAQWSKFVKATNERMQTLYINSFERVEAMFVKDAEKVKKEYEKAVSKVFGSKAPTGPKQRRKAPPRAPPAASKPAKYAAKGRKGH